MATDELEDLGPGTVLVADDNAANLALARDVLSIAGYRVLVALDGEAALRSMKTEKPELVLLDVHMPNGDGYEVCRRIKADPELLDLPVLFLSGMDEVFNKIQAFEAGAVDYVVKPFQAAELVARVRTQLELSRSRLRIRRYAERLEATLAALRDTERRLADSEKQAALGTLSSGLAHELNNPINYITVGAEALRRDFADLLAALDGDAPAEGGSRNGDLAQLSDEIPRLLEGIRLGAERSARLVRSLESFSNPESEEEAEVDIAALLDRAVHLVDEHRSRRPRVERSYSIEPRIRCFPHKLTKLLYSVIDNAYAAAALSADPMVRIEMDSSLEGVAVTIADNGPGVPAEIKERIFDPFFTTRDVGEGAGLGLTVARGIAVEHGGALDLLPVRAPGAIFRLILPYGAAVRKP